MILSFFVCISEVLWGLGMGPGIQNIFTVTDRFSKSVPLPKLPSALETTYILMSEVFKIHSILLDMCFRPWDHSSLVKFGRQTARPWAQHPV